MEDFEIEIDNAGRDIMKDVAGTLAGKIHSNCKCIYTNGEWICEIDACSECVAVRDLIREI